MSTSPLFDATFASLSPAPRDLVVPRGERPEHLPRNHSAAAAWADHDLLVREGEPAVAGVARASNHLFDAGEHPQLAAVVLAMPWEGQHRLGRVLDVTMQVASAMEGALAHLGEWPSLTRVPRSASGGDRFAVTTIRIARSDIPRGILTASWVPVLAHRGTSGVIPLPCSAWSPELVEAFTRWGGF